VRQVFIDKGNLSIQEVAQPLLHEYGVLISVHYSFISSGTEVATIESAKQSVLFSSVPEKVKKVLESLSNNGLQGTISLIQSRVHGQLQTLGYSCSGRVVAIGSKVKRFGPGDLVACAGAGIANHADIVCVPENLLVKVSDEKHLKEASITTIGAIAMQGIRRAQLQLGEAVCVIGLGLLGQVTVQLAKLAGCKVIGIDLIQERLMLAQRLGADAVYNPAECNVKKEIEYITQHQGVDTTLVTAASHSSAIVQHAMEWTRKKGKVVIVGDVGLDLERAPLYQKEIDFLISCSYGPGRYDPVYEQEGNDYPYAYVRWTENRNMQAFVELIEQGKINVTNLITAQVTLETIKEAYELIQNKQGLGVVVDYAHNQQQVTIKPAISVKELAHKNTITFMPALKDRTTQIRVGVVGAGGFAKIKLMPIIVGINNVKINAVVDADIVNSINVSRQYGVKKALVDDADLFNEDLADVVLIASPHRYHCDQALRALHNGCAVFLEKPMVTDFDQLHRFNNFLNQYPDAPLTVDYNRSFAPFMQKIKKEVEKRHSPLIVHYRMNAGFVPKEHWLQTEIGAGRLIGEACHIFDLFCYLTDSKPTALSVESLNAGRDDLFPTDNFSVQVGFADGSICTLLYTALGHPKLGKERMEVFFDSKSIVMDDYLSLHGFGLPSAFNEKVKTADKGHELLIKQFFNFIKRKEGAPINIERLKQVAEITLLIDQLACQGGGNKELAF
jgi:predicted dehydrogenase/threonine dehydrogenase-like Zn-dependent dehydrogenase